MLAVAVLVLANGAAASAAPFVQIATPDSLFGGSDLYAVSGDGTANVWAVGTQTETATFVGEPLAAHWTGSGFAAVTAPTFPGDGAYFNSVAAVPGTSQVWAVGDLNESLERGVVGIVELHSASGWTQFHPSVPSSCTPSNDCAVDFSSVIAFSQDQAILVGDCGGNPPAPSETLIWRWDGQHWHRDTQASTPKLAGAVIDGEFSQIAASSPSDVYVVGSDANSQTFGGYAIHYNGTKWNTVPLGTIPPMQDVAHMTGDSFIAADVSGRLYTLQDGQLTKKVKLIGDLDVNSIAASSDHVWVVGETHTAPLTPFIEERDNGVWTRRLLALDRGLGKVRHVPGTMQTWVVGGTTGQTQTVDDTTFALLQREP